MATILDQSTVCDGYDVRCELSNGEHSTFHFPSVPADTQAEVDLQEAIHLAVVVIPEPAAEEPMLEIVQE